MSYSEAMKRRWADPEMRAVMLDAVRRAGETRRKNTPPIQRFLSRINKTDRCWEWIGGKDNKGYGVFHLDGKSQGAHVCSWILHRGPIPPGICVLHNCDNPACVRPDHLFLGTLKDNTQDCIAKGRFKAGTKKLTNEQISVLRGNLKYGELKVLAAQFGICYSHASEVKNCRDE